MYGKKKKKENYIKSVEYLVNLTINDLLKWISLFIYM